MGDIWSPNPIKSEIWWLDTSSSPSLCFGNHDWCCAFNHNHDENVQLTENCKPGTGQWCWAQRPGGTIVISTSRAKVETGAGWVGAVLQRIVDYLVDARHAGYWSSTSSKTRKPWRWISPWTAAARPRRCRACLQTRHLTLTADGRHVGDVWRLTCGWWLVAHLAWRRPGPCWAAGRSPRPWRSCRSRSSRCHRARTGPWWCAETPSPEQQIVLWSIFRNSRAKLFSLVTRVSSFSEYCVGVDRCNIDVKM